MHTSSQLDGVCGSVSNNELFRLVDVVATVDAQGHRMVTVERLMDAFFITDGLIDRDLITLISSCDHV